MRFGIFIFVYSLVFILFFYFNFNFELENIEGKCFCPGVVFIGDFLFLSCYFDGFL